jgi:ubiquinone biosynthesis protein
MSTTLRTPRRSFLHIGRYGEILSVLIKYGFGDIVARLNLERYLSLPRKLLPRSTAAPSRRASRWERVLVAIEELGPTFMKLGQFLSNRPDLLPPELVTQLEKLQDAARPFPGSIARALVEKELGRTVEDAFASFSDEPVASASISQVHRATLKGGQHVAVKIRRPRVRHTVSTDIDIIYDLVALLERAYEPLRGLHLAQLVEEFERTIAKELDFTIEASHIERFRHDFTSDPDVHVARVHGDLVTQQILVTEWVDGAKITDLPELARMGVDPCELARRGTRLVLSQVFDHGFFHADPHPGNLLVRADGRICFLDFGAVGIIPPTLRHHLSIILYGVVNKDPQRIIRSLSQLTRERINNIERLEYDVTEFIEEYDLSMLKQINVGDVLKRFAYIVTEHDLRIPPGFYLLLKALITIEGVGSKLDPNFNLTKELEPFVKKLLRENPRLRYLPFDVYFTLLDMASLLKDLPFEIKDIVRVVKRGDLRIQFEHQGLEPLFAKSDQLVNRLVFALVLASLIVGSSVVIHSGIPPRIYDIPIIGIGGFAVAGLIGFGLLFSMIRQKKL